MQLFTSKQPLLVKNTKPSMKEKKVYDKAIASAKETARVMDQESQIVSPKMEAAIPRFDRTEIHCDKLLGKGSFNRVFSVLKFDLTLKVKSLVQQERREMMAHNPHNFAVKLLQKKKSNQHFLQAAIDLLAEAKLLTSLEHPNIIQLHGIPATGVYGFGEPGGFFLILDRLSCTLEDKLALWQVQGNTSNLQRMEVLVPLASALKYLHSKNCCFRDVKPGNIGFDAAGNLKLFDFGLCRELAHNEHLVDKTGTILYMAPEVYNHEPYDTSADIYSFCMLMFEVLSCQLLFMQDFEERVILGGARPVVPESWPKLPASVMQKGWSKDPSRRPPMEVIHRVLANYIMLNRPQRKEAQKRRPSL